MKLPDTIKVRRATAADFNDSVIELLRECWHPDYITVFEHFLGRDDIESKLIELSSDFKLGQLDIFIAWEGDVAVGISISDFQNGKRWLHDLATRPGYQNKGIAEACYKAIHDPGVPVYCVINKNNVPCIKLAEKMGFIQLNEEVVLCSQVDPPGETD